MTYLKSVTKQVSLHFKFAKGGTEMSTIQVTISFVFFRSFFSSAFVMPVIDSSTLKVFLGVTTGLSLHKTLCFPYSDLWPF